MKHIVAIVFAVLSVVLYVCGIHFQRTDVFAEQSMALYQFCHVNIWHLLGNMSALYSIESSSFKASWKTWLLAYLVSALIPCESPTEGMSGLLYAVMGIISWQAANTKVFHMWCAVFIGVCFLFPNAVNGWLHVWCYLAGVMIGLADVIWKMEKGRCKK